MLTVHNLAFQGIFPATLLAELELPPELFKTDGVEYFGRIGYLKSGLFYADRLTTVSPTYAREIQTAAHGMGLDGLLRTRAAELVGITNGIDTDVWDPATDSLLAAPFDAAESCRQGRQQGGGAGAVRPGAAGRCLPVLHRQPVHQPEGDRPDLGRPAGDRSAAAHSWSCWAAATRSSSGPSPPRRKPTPTRIGFQTGYDEPLSHLMQGGADAILIPSRFEPCGLTQLIGLRYGTLPVVARVGGLADTVIDANEAAIADGVATGFQFAPVTAEALAEALRQTISLFHDQPTWQKMVRRAMTRDVGWDRAARQYLTVYEELQTERASR